jgi:CubicO group peptidase (beta-lactamase class C family)
MAEDGNTCSIQLGYRDKKNDLKVNEATMFNAASISKPISAYVALKIYADKKINYREPINKVLKSWHLANTDTFKSKHVNIINLLGHNAGITGFRCKGYGVDEKFPTLIQALQGIKPSNTPKVRLTHKPDSKVLYSPGGYMIVEQAISDIEGKPFYQVVKKQLLSSLEMVNSTFQQPLPSSFYKNIALPYLPSGYKIPNGPLNFIASAAGGLWTTSKDLSKFFIAIQPSFKNEPHSKLNHKLVEKYLQPTSSNNWGIGIEVNLDRYGNQVKSGGYFGHSGFNSGYLGFALASKNHPIGFSVLLNTAPLMTTKGEVVQFGFIKNLNKKIAQVYQWK